jgi:NADPH2:quinone reductase
MQAWRVHEFGQPDEVIRLDDIPPPTPTDLADLRMSMGGWVPAGTPGSYPEPHEDWVIVEMAMAALALPDVTMAEGRYPVPVPRPYVSGQEGVGTVVDASPTHRHLLGKRIGACMIQPFGSLAPVAVGVGMIVEISPTMSDAEAAGYLIPAHTGWHAVIRRGEVAAGEVVAVIGAAGGLGSACVQLARARGAEVIGVVGSQPGGADKVAHCRELGAAHVVDHTTSDVADELLRLTGGRGVDVIVDPVQGAQAEAVRRGLRVGGRHVLCGHAGGLGPIDPHFYLRNHTLVGVTLGGYGTEEMRRINEETQAGLDALVATGRYRPNPTEVVEFADVPKALADLAARRTAGRVVVRCPAASEER